MNMHFEKWFYSIELLSEINKQIAKEIDDYYDDADNWTFSHIFPEDKTRLAYPFTSGSGTAGSEILNKIHEMGFDIDFENGLLVNGNRKIRLGKYILDKKSPFTQEEKDWWVKQGNPIGSLKSIYDKGNFAIILSRNPFDVIRMSDHDGWSSCHSPGGQYWQCAVGESKNAGGIAYVVDAKDLKEINLDDKEIFKDKNRNITGVSPISRLRIRKFVNKKTGDQLAMPEDRVYGKDIPGFRERVRALVKSLQSNIIGDKRLRMKDYNLMGGSYQDTAASVMFNKFFGDELDSGVADYAGEDDDHMGMAEQWEEEVERTKARYEGSYTFVYVYGEVEESDGQPYVSMSGGGDINIPKRFLIKPWDIPTDWRLRREHPVYKDILKILKDYFRYSISELEFVQDNDDITIQFNVEPDEDLNPDGFANFCDNMLDADKSGNEIKQQIMLELEAYGYIAKPSYVSGEMESDIHLLDQTYFKHFGFLFNEGTWDFNIQLKRPEPLFEFDENKHYQLGLVKLSNDRVFTKQVLDTVLFYMDKMDRLQKQQGLLFGEHPRIAPTESFRENFKLDDLKVGIYISENIKMGYDKNLIRRIRDLRGNYVLIDILLEMDSLNREAEYVEEMARIVKFMDDHFEQLRNQFTKLVLNQSSIYKK